MSSGDHTALSSVDSGFNEREDGTEGSKYLQDVLGDILSKALSLCARHRPKDPIQFVADYLYTHNRENPLVPIKDIESLSELARRPETHPHHHPHNQGGSNEHHSDNSHKNQSHISHHQHRSSGGIPHDNDDDLESDESIRSRKRRIRRSRRRRKSVYESNEDTNLRETAGSEPVPRYSPVEPKTPPISLKRSSSVGNRLVSNLPYDLSRFDPKLRNLSMKVPTVALPPDEYRRRRGFKWLPPMKDKPEYDASSAEDDSRYGSRNVSNKVYGQPRRSSNKKLEPLRGENGEKLQKKSKKKVYNKHHVRVK